MPAIASDDFWGLPNARRIFSAPRIDRDLVADFFMVFARAEHALKRAGYVTADRYDAPRIMWDDFARHVGAKLFDGGIPDVDTAIAYLQNHPPRREVVRSGTLDWEARTTNDPKDPVFLIRSLTTVRNNLFHGGKEINGLLAERDRSLLRSSLILLAHVLGLIPKVRRAFEELPPEQYAA